MRCSKIYYAIHMEEEPSQSQITSIHFEWCLNSLASVKYVAGTVPSNCLTVEKLQSSSHQIHQGEYKHLAHVVAIADKYLHDAIRSDTNEQQRPWTAQEQHRFSGCEISLLVMFTPFVGLLLSWLFCFGITGRVIMQ